MGNFDEKKYAEFVELYKTGKYTPEELAEIVQMHVATIYRWKAKYLEECPDEFSNLKDTHEVTEKGATSVAYSKNKPLTEAEMAEKFEVDRNYWEKDRLTINSWDVTNREGITYTNFQTKITWKRKENPINYDELLEEFISKAKQYAPKKSAWGKPKIVADAVYMREIPLYDAHFGKLAWAPETGEHFDIHIASARVFDSVQDILMKTKPFPVESNILVLGGDTLHYDNTSFTTTGGTRQDTDVRYQKAFQFAKNTMIDVIDLLVQTAPVKIINLRGNHDELQSFTFGEVIDAWYRHNPNVTVDNRPIDRKYEQYGKNLIGFTHGDLSVTNYKKLLMMMAQEVPDLWGKTIHREIHTGHKHNKERFAYLTESEEIGCMIRRMRSLSGTDAWHFKSGFVGSKKGLDCYIWHKDNGVIANIESTILNIEKD